MKYLIHTFASLLMLEASAQVAVDRAISTTQGAQRFSAQSRNYVKTEATEPDAVAPTLFVGELEDVGPQYLLARPTGLDGKTPAAAHQWFEAFFDTQLFYTSNALLTEKGNSDTGVMVTTLQAGLNLPPFALARGEASVRLGYRHQWWLYSLNDSGSQLNNFDFAVGTAFLQLRNSWAEQWVATLSLDYNRYLAREDGWNEFYVELVPGWSIERNIPLCEAATLTLGYYGAYHFTQTDPAPVSHINDRLNNSLGLFVTARLGERILAQPYYRFLWSHYTENSDRNDFYQTLGVALVYEFNAWASARLFVAYENRNSTDDLVADYGRWDTGVGITISARF